MNRHNGFKVAALAASIALAMSATSAMAAAPTATQLPGKGKITGTATVNSAGTSFSDGILDIDVNGVAVIDWGKGTGDEGNGNVNNTGVAGFNIGSDASVTFSGANGLGTDAVLNIDSSGNVSQIFGSLTANNASVFVANTNGVIVGKTGYITGNVGLIANTLSPAATTDFNATDEVEYSGTGGDVTVQAGAGLNGTILVSGGGTVNIDAGALQSDGITLSAGLPSITAGGFATRNDKASLNLSGDLGEVYIQGFSSAGDASNSGALYIVNADVAGTFTNTGTLTLAGNFAIDGAFVNEKSVKTDGDVYFGSLTNDGQFDAHGEVSTTDGGLTNNGQLGLSDFAVWVDGGDFTNNGQMTDVNAIGVDGGNFTNKGAITLDDDGAPIFVTGGDFVNAGSIGSVLEGGDAIYSGFTVAVTNGSLSNSGELDGFGALGTSSDSEDPTYTAGADYSITNSGSISATGGLFVLADASSFSPPSETDDSTGGFTNTGTLDIEAGPFISEDVPLPLQSGLLVFASGDVMLGGKLTSGGKPLSATNPLGLVGLESLNGVVTNATPLFVDGNTNVEEQEGPSLGGALMLGQQVNVMADITNVADGGTVTITAGHLDGAAYDVRVAAGKTVSAYEIGILGMDDSANPNVILQGTVAGNEIGFGDFISGPAPVGDVVTGPNGGIVATGDAPFVEFNFTGRIKSAPYLNDRNFRYNYLPITVEGTDALKLELDPAAYDTNGTSNGLSAVNILVDGSVLLDQEDVGQSVVAGNSAVTGVTDIPNTHLVVQSTGNIDLDGNFYWPGYVYLGTIAANADGSAAPGTLGLGQISLHGDFNNVLPGDISGASGVHFISQFPLGLDDGEGTYSVTTNANAWVNFGTDLLTEGYATGTLGGSFYGGTQAAGTVVTYGELDPSLFHTHAPVATR